MHIEDLSGRADFTYSNFLLAWLPFQIYNKSITFLNRNSSIKYSCNGLEWIRIKRWFVLMMIYVKYDTDIEIMTNSCGAEGRNILTFTVHVFCT